MKEWLERYPDRVANAIVAGAAVLVALTVWRSYRLGMATGAFTAIRAEADRIASEALGG